MIKTVSQTRCFGGTQLVLEQDSAETGLPMRCGLYLPPQAEQHAVPALLYLAGLTCNEDTFMAKAGAQRVAADLGLALIAPDTSPRGAAVEQIDGAGASWDFGLGAGFYLDATQAPWATHWRMESWLMNELLAGVADAFPVDADRIGIFGHSMGGHGALTLALRHPGRFQSVSALAPICAPSECAWGEKAFGGYLGADRTQWLAHDASALMQSQRTAPYLKGILVDQGLADKFLADGQLLPDRLEAACDQVAQPLTLRRHDGYDHGYHFVATFMEDHLRHHARVLGLAC
ncbi:MAG: S-formylglutathione hydrolase [Burkholderiales bacterium]